MLPTMTKPHRLALPLLACALLLPSCFIARHSTNEPIDNTQVKKLTPGRSTAKECVQIMGAPSDVVQLGKRFAYRYDHTIEKGAGTFLLVVALFNEDARQDRVWLFFDENGVLSHMGSTFASQRAEYSMPWEDIHENNHNGSAENGR
jgi:outer membrane protein assembly factor BamE (lipoprotein component of BamABCDE complex)